MPKRMLDDAMLSSESLGKCSPRAQDAFPRFILLADDFGCFDANPRVLVGKGWPLRDDVDEHDVRSWLEEYVSAGMAVLWTEKERRWCFLTGWFGPHGQRRRVEYDPKTVAGQKGSKRRTPAPPADLVEAVEAGLRRDHDGKPPGTDREDEFPAREVAQENINESVPAREIQIPAAEPPISREVPAHAVAVPVAVAVPQKQALALVEYHPVGGVTQIPTLAEHLAERYPALMRLVAALDAAGLGRSLPRAPTTRGALNQLVERHGVDALVADVAQVPEGKHLGWLAARWADPAFRPPRPSSPPAPSTSGCPEWDQVLAGLRDVFAAQGRGDAAGSVARIFAGARPERVNGSIRLSGLSGLAMDYLADVDRIAQEGQGLHVEAVKVLETGGGNE